MSQDENWNYQTLHKLVEKGEESPKSSIDITKQGIISIIQQEMQKALETINKLRSEKNKLKASISELTSKNDELYKKATSYKARYQEENKRRKQAENNVKHLEDLIRDLTTQKSELEEKLKNFEGVNAGFWDNLIKTEKEWSKQLNMNSESIIQHAPLIEELNLNCTKLIKKISCSPTTNTQFKKRLNLKLLIQSSKFDEALLKLIQFVIDILPNYEEGKQSSLTPQNNSRQKFEFDRGCTSPTCNGPKRDQDILSALASQNYELTKINQQLFQKLLINPTSPNNAAKKRLHHHTKSARASPGPREETYGSDSTDKYYNIKESGKDILVVKDSRVDSVTGKHHRKNSDIPRSNAQTAQN